MDLQKNVIDELVIFVVTGALTILYFLGVKFARGARTSAIVMFGGDRRYRFHHASLRLHGCVLLHGYGMAASALRSQSLFQSPPQCGCRLKRSDDPERLDVA